MIFKSKKKKVPARVSLAIQYKKSYFWKSLKWGQHTFFSGWRYKIKKEWVSNIKQEDSWCLYKQISFITFDIIPLFFESFLFGKILKLLFVNFTDFREEDRKKEKKKIFIKFFLGRGFVFEKKKNKSLDESQWYFRFCLPKIEWI